MCVAEYIVLLPIVAISEFWWRLAETTLLIKLNHFVVLLSQSHYRVMIVLGKVTRKQHIGIASIIQSVVVVQSLINWMRGILLLFSLHYFFQEMISWNQPLRLNFRDLLLRFLRFYGRIVGATFRRRSSLHLAVVVNFLYAHRCTFTCIVLLIWRLTTLILAVIWCPHPSFLSV